VIRFGPIVRTILRPLGLELRRLPHGQRARAGTLHNALRCLREVGFYPATVLDVGVASGTPALYETFPSAHHVLVEPLAEFTPDLERIVAGLPHAEYVLAAAGAASGTAVLHFGRHLEVTSTRHLEDRAFAISRERTVPCLALDEIWATRHLAGPALLKLDVEGGELDAIAGARATLPSCPCLVVEAAFQRLYTTAPTVEQVIAEITRLGYSLFDVVGAAYHSDGRLVTADLVFVDARALDRAPVLT
jgi:FkbM family methyltransferase